MKKHEVGLEDFLKPIENALGHTEAATTVVPLDTEAMIPPHVTDGLSKEELIARFQEESGKIGAKLARCDRRDLAGTVRRVVEETGGGKVIYVDDSRFDELGIEKELRESGSITVLTRWDTSKGRVPNVEAARIADIGITFSIAGIAETGTVVLACDEHCGRSISLLPAVHIAIIDTASITASMLDVLKCLEKDSATVGLPSQVCFISGPSNTADIELVRVEGVHGPTAVRYILVDD